MKHLILLLIGLLSVATTHVVSAETTAPTATFMVDRSDDASGLACTASANDCTLRSAIQLANSDSGTVSVILFADTLSQINLQSSLPAITRDGTLIWNLTGNRIIIHGGGTVYSGFRIQADDVSLLRLTLQGFTGNYIDIIGSSSKRARIANMALEGNCDPGASRGNAIGIIVFGDYSDTLEETVAYIVGNAICGMQFGIYVQGEAKVDIGTDTDGMSTSDDINIIFQNFYGILATNACALKSEGSVIINNDSHGVVLDDGRYCFNRFNNDHVVNNGGSGFIVGGDDTKVAISPREVRDNGGIPIDLGGDGWTSNDGSADLDSGPNDLYNSPDMYVADGDPPNIITIQTWSVDGHDPFKIYLYEAIGNPTQAGGGGKLIDTLFIPDPDPNNWIVKIDTNDYPELTTGYITAVAFRLGDLVTSEMSFRHPVPTAPTSVTVQQTAVVSTPSAHVIVVLFVGLIGLSWSFGRKVILSVSA